jgi:hypothetical protein
MNQFTDNEKLLIIATEMTPHTYSDKTRQTSCTDDHQRVSDWDYERSELCDAKNFDLWITTGVNKTKNMTQTTIVVSWSDNPTCPWPTLWTKKVNTIN